MKNEKVKKKKVLHLYFFTFFIFLFSFFFLSACSSRLGWGVLLWSTEEPPIPSGTILPVYIRSNIDRVWVTGLPEGWRSGRGEMDKIEIPLSHLTLVGSKSRALKWAEDFSDYALLYAENLQDGLPIRSHPDNNSRRVYRLRSGEIIKILETAQGNPAISATGDPLPGSWYKVLAEDGTIGFCFSYRLRLFEYYGGPIIVSVPVAHESTADPDLDMLMSRIWSHDSYLAMINNRRLNLETLSRRWRFDPGPETGVAHISVPGINRSFPYTEIRPDGPRTWRFEGTSLAMQLRNDTTLSVQLMESGGGIRNLLFVSLPVDVDDLILQETARRERLYHTIYSQGPVFTSHNFGVITFMENGAFSWRGFDLLVPQHIPQTEIQNGEGNGSVIMDLFLSSDLQERYNGAFSLRFSNGSILRCMYSLDNQGFRLEIVPAANIEDNVVTRRAASPMVLFFFRETELW